MKKHRPNTEHLKSTEIEAYLNASLSDSEMHRIERHLLECEFCNEAMDGYASSFNDINIQKELNDLNARIGQRIKKRSFPLFRIAAIAIVLIAAAIYIANYVVKENKNPQFSEKKQTKTEELKEESKKLKKEKESSDSTAIINSSQDDKKNEEDERSDKKIKIASASKSASTLKEENALSKEKPLQSDEDIVKAKVADADQIVLSEKSTYQARSESNYTMEMLDQELIIDNIQIENPNERKKSDLIDSSSNTENDSLVIQGRILDENKEGIPFAVIQNKHKNKRTNSDIEGNYQIEAEKGDEIEVQNIGYESSQVVVANEKRLDVALKAGVDLEEVVVVKNVHQNSKAKPYIGFEEYEAYLNENLRYPDTAKKANIQGKVIVDFLVDEEGNISRFTITKSLGYGCDEEAIRLIKEGPQWKSAHKKGNPITDEVKVKVLFK